MQGLIGTKVGMTRVFGANGVQVPVTVLAMGPCVVIQRKTVACDGYDAVQLGLGEQKASRLSRAEVEHCKKAGTEPKRVLREVLVGADEAAKAGDAADVSVFEGIAYVDVTARSKGRGFQGVVKRYGMRGGPMTHGGHSKRRVGSIGCSATSSRVYPGKRMPGHHGHVNVTVQNLKVVQVRREDHALLVEGAVPGPNGGLVVVRRALKKAAKAS